MDRIPLEILQKVLWQLRKPLAPYAVVSRLFQHVIESKTFNSIRVSNEDDSLNQLEGAFSDPRRRSLLRTLYLTIDLPYPQLDHFNGLEHENSPLSTPKLRDEELVANNNVYTEAIQGLFSRLQRWNEASTSADEAPYLHLIIMFSPLTTRGFDNMRKEEAQSPPIEFDDSLQALPSLSCVERFGNGSMGRHHVHESAIGIILKALPRVQAVDWYPVVPPCEPAWEARRAELRSSLTSTLRDTSFAHLVDLRLIINEADFEPADMPPDFPAQQFVKPGGKDHLSIAVNRISKLPNLKNLFLEGNFILSPEVFNLDDDTNSHNNNNNNDNINGGILWGSLQHMKLSVSKMTPTGGRYFNPSARPDLFAWEYNVANPNPITFFPFATAMAHAVVRMPALRNFCCEFPQHAYLFYATAGERLCDTDWKDLDGPLAASHLAHRRWIMDFGSDRTQDYDDDVDDDDDGGGAAAQFEWELPSKMVAVLKEAEHRIFRTSRRRVVEI